MKSNIDALVADLRPVTPVRPLGGILVSLSGAAAAALLVGALLGIRPDIAAAAPHPMVMLREGMLLILGFASLAAVVASARPGVGHASHGWRWALAAAALFPLSAMLLAVTNGRTFMRILTSIDGPICLGVSLAAALLIGALQTAWLRRGAPTAPNLAGWLVGLTSGSFGAFAYGLHCQSISAMYAGVWYSIAIGLCAVLGRLIVPRFVRW